MIEALLAFEFGLYGEGKELFLGFDLQNGGVIVSEVIIGALPKICVRIRDYFDFFVGNAIAFRLASLNKLARI